MWIFKDEYIMRTLTQVYNPCLHEWVAGHDDTIFCVLCKRTLKLRRRKKKR